MLVMSWIYSGESLFTILNTSHAISLSLLTWRGSVLVWLSNFLRDEDRVFVCVFFCVFFFYFIKISKFALPGVMLMYERTSKDRKRNREKE